MTRSIAAILLTASGCGSGSAMQREFDGAQAMVYARTQVNFGPRIPNTEGHRRAGDWILEQLRMRADSVEVQSFSHVTVEGDTLNLRNFVGKFRPELTDRIVYVAHWDTRPQSDQSRNVDASRRPVPGANDGASGVALLLGVADVLARRPSPFGVDLVFVDGEDYGDFGVGKDVLLGSRHYAAGLDSSQFPLFAVVWDMIGDADLRILQEGHSVSRAPEVVERVWNTARDLGYERVFRPTVRSAITDDHVPLLDVGVRAIDVIDLNYPYWHTPDDTIDRISQASLQIVGDVAIALLR